MSVEIREEPNRPCLIVAHGDATYTSLVSRSFRRLGWDTYEAHNGPEARRLARMLEPDLLVMATDLEIESGWLTCEKVKREQPTLRVVLIGDASDSRNQAFAAFLGAALFDSGDSIASLAEDASGNSSLPAAG